MRWILKPKLLPPIYITAEREEDREMPNEAIEPACNSTRQTVRVVMLASDISLKVVNWSPTTNYFDHFIKVKVWHLITTQTSIELHESGSGIWRMLGFQFPVRRHLTGDFLVSAGSPHCILGLYKSAGITFSGTLRTTRWYPSGATERNETLTRVKTTFRYSVYSLSQLLYAESLAIVVIFYIPEERMRVPHRFTVL